MGNISENLAKEVTKAYAGGSGTMEEIADIFNNLPNSTIFLNSKKVSKCIYHCLFYRLISKEYEDAIMRKITENINRHLPSSSLRYIKTAKHLMLIKDRQEFFDLENSIKQLNKIISVYEEREDLIIELEQASAFNYEDYLSSEDERSFIPPRDKDAILEDIDFIDSFLKVQDYSFETALMARNSFEKKLNAIKSRYAI